MMRLAVKTIKERIRMSSSNVPDSLQQLRGDAIRTQITIAHALCAVTHSQPHGEPAGTAQEVLTSIRYVIDEILAHLNQPHALSESAARELTQLIAELQQGVGAD
jgi:hypothetical protein